MIPAELDQMITYYSIAIGGLLLFLSCFVPKAYKKKYWKAVGSLFLFLLKVPIYYIPYGIFWVLNEFVRMVRSYY